MGCCTQYLLVEGCRTYVCFLPNYLDPRFSNSTPLIFSVDFFAPRGPEHSALKVPSRGAKKLEQKDRRAGSTKSRPKTRRGPLAVHARGQDSRTAGCPARRSALATASNLRNADQESLAEKRHRFCNLVNGAPAKRGSPPELPRTWWCPRCSDNRTA